LLPPPKTKIAAAIRRSEDPSPIHARMRAALAGLDECEFSESHELDRKMRVPSVRCPYCQEQRTNAG
jgi:hypothetical protein